MDNTFIKDIRAGNKQVLANTYTAHRKEFIQWAYKTHNCPFEDAKEIYQLIFLIFYDNVMSGKLESMSSNLKTYLFAIGKNKIKELKRFKDKFKFDIKEEIIKMEEHDYSSQQEAELRLQQIASGLQQLGDPCKHILEMVYYEDRSMDYITVELGYKNVNTTKNLKYKCMQRLKKIVEGIQVQ